MSMGRWDILVVAGLAGLGCGKSTVSADNHRDLQEGAGDAQAPPSEPECDGRLLLCGKRCVDPEFDPLHCGECGNTCPDEEVCSAGRCIDGCGAGTERCGSLCVDLANDPDNCGECGNLCDSDEVCSRSACALQCAGDTTRCGQGCFDLEVDPENCGSCGEACGVGEVCSGGQCGLQCAGGTTRCGDRCFDLEVDSSNCGGCGDACDAGEVCSNGKCGFECFGGTARCDDRCVDVDEDPFHCGRCDNTCLQGSDCVLGQCTDTCSGMLTRCGETCTNLASDNTNCGKCGHACEGGLVCSNGSCSGSCVDSIRCDNQCVDPLSNADHCGGCGKACDFGYVCENGSCKIACEDSGADACGTQCVFTEEDPQHCGVCFRACGSDRSCDTGQCVCKDGKTECVGKCTDTTQDNQHCGVCGVACEQNEQCSNSKCECREGTERCGEVCVDTSVSAQHCGECDALCPVGQVCTDGECSASSSDWPTFQANVKHSGENLTESGHPPLRLAWQRYFPEGVIQPVAASGGRIFVTQDIYFKPEAPVRALNVSDGSDLWDYNFGSIFSVGLPSVFSDRLYLANGKDTGGGAAYLWSFHPVSGEIEWGATLSAQWETYWSPIRVGDVVYTNGGSYGGLYGIAAADGAQKFFQTLPQYDEWSPAYFDGHLYTFIAGGFRKHDPATGEVLANVSTGWNWSGYAMRTVPVFGEELAYLIAPPNLVAVDPGLEEVAWSANGTYTGTPAVAGNSVYAVSAGNLVVRSAETGALQWTFVGDTQFRYPPVIASGYVYVASANNVYGVNIATHEQEFHADVGGWLAIADHRLIVAGGYTLSAFVMSQ